eukprot:1056247-Rhodomonas_salina.2
MPPDPEEDPDADPAVMKSEICGRITNMIHLSSSIPMLIELPTLTPLPLKVGLLVGHSFMVAVCGQFPASPPSRATSFPFASSDTEP